MEKSSKIRILRIKNKLLFEKLKKYIYGTESNKRASKEIKKNINSKIDTLIIRDRAMQEQDRSSENSVLKICSKKIKEIKLEKASWIELNTYIKEQLLKTSNSDKYTGKFDKPIKDIVNEAIETLIKKESIYATIYKVYNYINADVLRILANQAIASETILKHKFMWNIGKNILNSFMDNINMPKAIQVIKSLENNIAVIDFISSTLETQKFPKRNKFSQPEIKNYFDRIRKTFVEEKSTDDNTDTLMFILIIKLLKNNIENVILRPKAYLDKNNMLHSFFKDYSILELRKKKIKIINILTMFEQIIGIEVTNELIKYGIITEKRTLIGFGKKTGTIITFNNDKFIYPVQRELPNLIRTPNKDYMQVRKNQDIFSKRQQIIHSKDFMETQILDYQLYEKAAPQFILNDPFKNFSKIYYI